jgi:hypothetical protein
MRLMFHPTPGDPHGGTLLDRLNDTQLRELQGLVEEKSGDFDCDPKFEHIASIWADKDGGVRITVQRLMSAASVNGAL